MADENEVSEVSASEVGNAPLAQGPGIIPETVWDEFLKGQSPEEKPGTEENPDETHEPGQKPEPKQEPKPEETTEEEEPQAIGDTLSEIDKVLGEINAKLDAPKPESAAEKPEPAKPEIDPAIKALLEHEDPAVSRGAKALLERQDRIESEVAGMKNQMVSREIAEEAVRVEAEMKEAATTFGLTNEQVEKVAEYLESDPVLASTLTFKEGILRVFPDATPRTKPTPTEPAGKPGATVRVASQPREKGATIVDRAAAAGAVPKVEKPPEGESMEQVVARGWKNVMGST